jgi:flavodoxin
MAKKAVIIYWSKTGNTEKVAHSIKEGLNDAGLDVSLLKTDEADDLDYFDHDLVCLGFLARALSSLYFHYSSLLGS